MTNPLIGRGPDGTLEDLKSSFIAERDGLVQPLRIPYPQLNMCMGHGLSAGEVTLMTGPPGTAKSYFVLNLLLAAREANFNPFLFPFEDSAEIWLKKILGVRVGKWDIVSVPDEDSKHEWQRVGNIKLNALKKHREFLEYWHANCIAENPRLPLIVDGRMVTPGVPYSAVLDCIRREAEKKDFIAVDNISQIDFSQDGRDWIFHSEFMREVMSIAAASGCHIILVAHSTKNAARLGISGTIDAVQGSALFTRLAHNVITITRHDETESVVIGRNGSVKHNLTVTVSKCRNGRGNGSFAFDLTPGGPNFIEHGLIVKQVQQQKLPAKRANEKQSRITKKPKY